MTECDHPTEADHTDHEEQGAHHDGRVHPGRYEVVVGIALVTQWEETVPVVSVCFPVSGVERLVVNEPAGVLAVEPAGGESTKPHKHREEEGRPRSVPEPARPLPGAGTQPSDQSPDTERGDSEDEQERNQ